MDLTKKKCVPCEGNTLPFTEAQAKEYAAHVQGWWIVQNKLIKKEFVFADFVRAMAFVDKVADVAELEGHHPDIHISYSKVTLELSTHAINGLSENDFILAAKIDEVK